MATEGKHFRMSLMLALGLALMLAEVTVCDEGAQHSLAKRQVRRCPAGVPCRNIVQCQPMLELLRMRTQEAFRKVVENICYRRGRTVGVCCGNGGGGVGGEDLLPKDCRGTTGTKILGGKEVTLGSMPFIALLGYSDGTSLQWRCGGALINQRYVLSAAHCFDREYFGNFRLSRVVLGEHDQRTSPDCRVLQTGQTNCADREQVFTSFPSGSIIQHENYRRPNDISNDIALIRLDRPAVLTSFVQPICLLPANQNARAFLGGRRAIAAGWGSTNNSRGSESPVLLGVGLPYVDFNTCAPFFDPQLSLNEGQICFGGVQKEDTCRGDSGGPLIAASSFGPPFRLIGITSSGAPIQSYADSCGRAGVPAVYSDVTYYRNWIVSKLRP